MMIMASFYTAAIVIEFKLYKATLADYHMNDAYIANVCSLSYYTDGAT